MDNLQRSNRILNKKILQYLFPTMVTTAALSLNEFVDSMLVANLIGSDAMAVVNLGFPVMMCYAGVYILLGNGGATLYAVCLGKRKMEKAGQSFSLSLIAALLTGVFLMLCGFLLFSPLSGILCTNTEILPDFKAYFHVLLISAPFLTTILTFTEFLPPSGAPAYATAVNVVANGVNLLMDYVYIRFFHMGVEGAAWATLTGYLVGTGVIVYILCSHKVAIQQAKITKKDIRLLKEIVGLGGPSAISQIGFAVKFGFCNMLASLYGGIAGVVCFSLCIQTLSIVSVFLAAVIGATMPLAAVLHGQRDFRGETEILKIAMKYQTIISIVSVFALECFPEQLAALYSISDGQEMEMAVNAVRIFAILYLFRGFYMVFMKYFQVIARKKYSMLISLMDGVGIVPLSALFCIGFGLEGLWWSYVVLSICILLMVVLWNKRICYKSDGLLRGWLLSARDDSAEDVLDVTVPEEAAYISAISEQLMHFCSNNGIDKRSALFAALVVEEMAVYTKNRMRKADYLDILAKLYQDRVEIDFRSLGKPFDPRTTTPADITENMMLLQTAASTMEYHYIMGMNCTKITVFKNKTRNRIQNDLQ